MFSALAPILWYTAGLVHDGWSLFLFVLSMAASVAAVCLGWCHRSGPSGWGALLGSLMAAIWLLIAVAALASVATGSFVLFVTAVDWVNTKLEIVGNAVAGFDAVVLVGVSTAGASGLAGLAVVVPLGTKCFSESAVESLDGAVDLLMVILVAAGTVFGVYVLARVMPSTLYAGAVSFALVGLAPMCVAAPTLVGYILRKTWQLLRSSDDSGDIC